MYKKGIVVTAIFIFSTAVQLVSQIIVTRIFGATLSLDIFLAAVALPTIFVTVIYGTLNDAFLPLYGERYTASKDESDDYFFSHFILLLLGATVLTFVLGFFSTAISSVLYATRSDTFVRDVALQMQYMFWSIPVSVVATMFGGYFYIRKQFVRFPLAQAAGSLFNVVTIVFLAPFMGMWALVTAFIANIVFQLFFIIPDNILKISFSPVNITPLIVAWIPLMIGTLALRSDTILIRSFASSLPEGYLVYFNLVSKIFALSTSVMTIGIQILLLPHLIEYFSNKEFEKAIRTVKKAKLVAVAVCTVITLAVMLLSPLLIHLLFVGGRFTAEDSRIAATLVPLFVIPGIGWGINNVFFQPLLALKKQLHLGVIHMVSVALGWASGTAALSLAGPLTAIPVGLIVMLFTGIIGSELLWQHYKKGLLTNAV